LVWNDVAVDFELSDGDLAVPLEEENVPVLVPHSGLWSAERGMRRTDRFDTVDAAVADQTASGLVMRMMGKMSDNSWRPTGAARVNEQEKSSRMLPGLGLLVQY
jgi:hypothetical protein